MKKLFPDDNNRKKSIRDFLDRKGFYIVLLLCIAIVGVTAIYVTTRNAITNVPGYEARNIVPEKDAADAADAVAELGKNLDAKEPIGTAATAADVKVAANDIVKVVPSKNDVKPTAAPKANTGISSIKTTKSSAPNTKAADAKAASAKAVSAKTDVCSDRADFAMPVFGEVTFEYAKDKLVYSKTLEEWRSHEGIDLAADRGTPVKAVADGVVSEIKNDPRFGIVVVLDHGDRLESVYANLASDDMVTPNQKIKQGDIIGSVGNTAVFESAEQSHLHFEVIKDGTTVDPAKYLPDIKIKSN